MSRLIVLSGGGTAGHVTPNIALFPKLKSLGYDIHYIGTKAGIERGLIEAEGIPYHAISAGKLRRYLSAQNFTDPFRVIQGFGQAYNILKKLKPDVVFTKGGFVSLPVIVAAKLRRIPTVTHESDITPGLANRLAQPFVSMICYSFPETGQHLPKGKGVWTGSPIRKSLLEGNAGKGRIICGFDNDKPVLMVTGGSLGAGAINAAIRDALNTLLKSYYICHICGKGNIDISLEGRKGYKQFEYVTEEQPHIFAMSDIVVSRAGANTLFEMVALRKPNLLIPLSRKGSRGDQILNAESFSKQGFSLVLPEEELTESSLVSSIEKLYKNRDSYIKTMEKSEAANGVDAVIDVIEGIQRKKR